MYVCVYIYINIYICINVYTYTWICIYDDDRSVWGDVAPIRSALPWSLGPPIHNAVPGAQVCTGSSELFCYYSFMVTAMRSSMTIHGLFSLPGSVFLLLPFRARLRPPVSTCSSPRCTWRRKVSVSRAGIPSDRQGTKPRFVSRLRHP